jgi:hypothetical protein
MSQMDDSASLAEDLDDDSQVGAAYPPDQPLGVKEYGITPAEDLVPEPLAERVAREEPDVSEADIDERLADDDELLRPVGRLADSLDTDVPGFDDLEADAVAGSVIDGELDDETAEEAAMHITADPPMGEEHDGYY